MATWEDSDFNEEVAELREKYEKLYDSIDIDNKHAPYKQKLLTKKEQIQAKRTLKNMKQNFEFLPKGLKLYDYQNVGVEWLNFSYSQDRDVILADEMGLGKTIRENFYST